MILKKIKDVFASNIASNQTIDEKEIFGNPIYERLIGSHETVNQKFDGNLKLKISELKEAFGEKLKA